MILLFVEEVPLELYEVGGEEDVVAEGGEDVVEDGGGGWCECGESAVFTKGGGCGEGAGLGAEVEAKETGAAVVGWRVGERCHCWLCVVGRWTIRTVRVYHCCFGWICSCDVVV